MIFIGILIAGLSILGIIFSRLITTFFHELGHAIPALMFCKGEVKMYVGSYGNKKNSRTIRLGRLTSILRFNIWDLQLGLCTHQAANSKLKALIILVGGPFLSLLIGVSLLLLLFSNSMSDGAKFVASIFMISSFWDFIINIIPNNSPVQLYDGSEVYNDGMQFKRLFRQKELPEAYQRAMGLEESGNIEEALEEINKLIDDDQDAQIYHDTKLCLLRKSKAYKEYIAAMNIYMPKFSPTVNQIAFWAESNIKMHNYDEVVHKLTNLIYHGSTNYHFYYQRAKALIELGEYRDALIDFNALTQGSSEVQLALANRAYCQFKLGYVTEAQEDITKALKGNKEENGEMYFIAGQIFEQEEPELALVYYKKSQELNFEHHALAFNISQLERFDV